MRHIVKNVNYPIEAYQKKEKVTLDECGMRLARLIENKKGLEIVVFDKGPGIRNKAHYFGIF